MTDSQDIASKDVAPIPDSSGIITNPDERFDDDTLAAVGSYSDALELLSGVGAMAEDFAETYGTGFTVLDTKDKKRLVGVDMALLEWSFNIGKNGPFVSVALVTEPGEKLILNDGSTGVFQQLVAVTRKRTEKGVPVDKRQRGLRVRKGLRVSEYPVKDDGTPLTKDELREHPELAKGEGITVYLAN